ncbi:MAG: acyltransferase family protein [Methanococcaceae archaeon]
MERLKEVDSLRGLAAFSVLIGHFLNIFPDLYSSESNSHNFWINLIKFSPLHILWAAHEAVIFFFVLSGFVLALPYFYGKSKINYVSYLIKRICRIYFPYIIAVAISLTFSLLFYKGGIPYLSDWFNRIWSSQIDSKLLLDHLFLLGSFENAKLNPVLWSLVHEMRISLIFPFIVKLVDRYNWKTNIIISIITSTLGYLANYLMFHYTLFSNDYFSTVQYAGYFITGAVIAKNYKIVVCKLKTANKTIKIFALGIALLLYSHVWWVDTFVNEKVKFFHIPVLNELIISLSVSLILLISISSDFIKRGLNQKWLLYLGDISYSLYLYHAICLAAILYLLNGVLPISLLLTISLLASFLISTISYHYVEITSIKMGKYLSLNINKSVLSNPQVNISDKF